MIRIVDWPAVVAGEFSVRWDFYRRIGGLELQMRETLDHAVDIAGPSPAAERWTVRRCAFVVLGLSALFWLSVVLYMLV